MTNLETVFHTIAQYLVAKEPMRGLVETGSLAQKIFSTEGVSRDSELTREKARRLTIAIHEAAALPTKLDFSESEIKEAKDELKNLNPRLSETVISKLVTNLVAPNKNYSETNIFERFTFNEHIPGTLFSMLQDSKNPNIQGPLSVEIFTDLKERPLSIFESFDDEPIQSYNLINLTKSGALSRIVKARIAAIKEANKLRIESMTPRIRKRESMNC